MNFKDFKGMIFDLDGTLVKSSHVWSDIDKKFLGKRGIPVPKDYYKQISAMNFEQAARFTNEHFGLNESIEDIQKEWFDMAIYEYSNCVDQVEGADEFLRYIKENGVKIALATASNRSLYEPVLKRNGIYDYFDFFASTEQVKRGKGFPDVYEFAAKGLGLKPCECAVFEDILEGVRGAKAGNFTAVACLNAHYIDDFEKIKSEADLCFETYLELLQSQKAKLTI